MLRGVRTDAVLPGAPVDLRVLARTHNSATLQWIPPIDGHPSAPVHFYELAFRVGPCHPPKPPSISTPLSARLVRPPLHGRT